MKKIDICIGWHHENFNKIEVIKVTVEKYLMLEFLFGELVVNFILVLFFFMKFWLDPSVQYSVFSFLVTFFFLKHLLGVG